MASRAPLLELSREGVELLARFLGVEVSPPGKVVGRETSLAARFPSVAARWHPTKNGSMRPAKVLPTCSKKVWWRCPVDATHAFHAAVSAVIRSAQAGNSGCPWCAGKKVARSASLAALFPAIAREWDPDENGELRPHQVTSKSGRRIAWRCSTCSHAWRASVAHRAHRNHGCPACRHKTVTGATSLATCNPAIAAEWHPTLNGKLGPGDVVPGSQKKVLWRCAKDRRHTWEATVDVRTRLGRGCPLCRQLTRAKSLGGLYPKLAKEWDVEANGGTSPFEVSRASNTKVWWRCAKDRSHRWQALVYSRSALGTGCPVCSGRRVSPATSLRATHPHVSREWHPTRNAELTPDDVGARSKRKVWWRCARDRAHEWCATVAARVRGSRCPACVELVPTQQTTLRARFPELAAEWHPTRNGDLTPDDVTARSTKKVVWRCAKDPSHVWSAPVSRRTKLGTGCPACAGRVVTKTRSLAARFPEIAREWHPELNGSLRAKDVVGGSHRRVWWRCPKDPRHAWEARVTSRTSKARSCPHCNTRTAGPFNSLAAVEPVLAAEWHPTKNAGLTPDDVVPGCNTRVWWRCGLRPRHHQWVAAVASRAKAGTGCPFCAGKRGAGQR